MATIDTVAAQVTALQAAQDAINAKLLREYIAWVYTIIAAPSSSGNVTGEGEWTPATPAALGAPYKDLIGYKVNLVTVPDEYGYRGVSRKVYYNLGELVLRDGAGLWTEPVQIQLSGQGVYYGRTPGQRIYYNTSPGVVIGLDAIYTRTDQP